MKRFKCSNVKCAAMIAMRVAWPCREWLGYCAHEFARECVCACVYVNTFVWSLYGSTQNHLLIRIIPRHSTRKKQPTRFHNDRNEHSRGIELPGEYIWYTARSSVSRYLQGAPPEPVQHQVFLQTTQPRAEKNHDSISNEQHCRDH